MTSQIWLALGLLSLTECTLQGTQLIKGNSSTNTETTSFAIGPTAFTMTGSFTGQPTMYLGAGSAVSGNTYAIASVSRTETQLVPLTPAKVNLNGTKDSSNPLYGAQIDFLKLISDCPVVVPNGANQVYQFSSMIKQKAHAKDPDGSEQYFILASSTLKDSANATIGNILDLETERDGSGHSFIAVTNNANQDFGNSGSGVALIKKVTPAGASSNLTIQNNGQAVSLTNSTSAIKINDDVVLANAVTMHWSDKLKCLFVGLQPTTGSNASSGARSVVVGKIKAVSGQSYEEISWEAIAPDAAFTGTNQIVGTVGASQIVSALRLQTLTTSTRLPYLIVVGGNGAANTVGNQVYALPLVNDDSTNQGHLAKADASAISETYTSGTNLFTKRVLSSAATTASDLLTDSDPAAKVGGGVLPLAASEQISELFTVGDSVYISTGDTAVSGATGLYQSQAILDQDGLIANWTPWQKVGGYSDKIYGAALDQIQGIFWRFTGADAANVKTLSRTEWGKGNTDGLLGGTTSNASLGLVNQINNSFSQGVYNLINIPKTDTLALNGLNLLVSTGFAQVSIINPSAASAGDFATNATSSINDIIPATSANTTIINITGTNLSTIGAITTANLATNSTSSSWLFVGGSNGVAVLRQTSGAGWAAPISDLSALTASLKFETLGNYQFVKKITSDRSYVYILTDQKLDRIALSNVDILTGSSQTIAQVGALSGTTTSDCYNDFIVSGDLGVLATSAGLYRTANSDTIHSSSPSWTRVTVPEPRAQNCVQLITVTESGLDQELINGGNLYVVSAYRGLHQAQVNRFYVYSTSTINDATIQPLADLFVKDSDSYFINFESFRDGFFTDGGLLMDYLSYDNNQKSFVQILPGQASGLNSRSPFSYNVPLDSLNSVNFISGITRDSNAGAILVSGQFGLQVNE